MVSERISLDGAATAHSQSTYKKREAPRERFEMRAVDALACQRALHLECPAENAQLGQAPYPHSLGVPFLRAPRVHDQQCYARESWEPIVAPVERTYLHTAFLESSPCHIPQSHSPAKQPALCQRPGER